MVTDEQIKEALRLAQKSIRPAPRLRLGEDGVLHAVDEERDSHDEWRALNEE